MQINDLKDFFFKLFNTLVLNEPKDFKKNVQGLYLTTEKKNDNNFFILVEASFKL